MNRVIKRQNFGIVVLVNLLNLVSCSNSKIPLYYDWYVEKISLDKLWEKENISDSFRPKIAIIDSGFDNDYLQFLNSNIIYKYNVFDESEDITDFYGHGTIITDIIGGKNDGSSKFSGINPNSELILIKGLNNQGISNSMFLTKAIDYAIEKEADIINLSLGSQNDYFGFHSAIERAIEKNIFLISAVGDSEANEFFYPSLYDNVFAIGNQTMEGELDSKSNRSINKELILMPGEKILYPIIEEEKVVYKTNTGSSFSCAIFTGVFSLLISKFENVTYENVYEFFLNKDNYKGNFIDLSKFKIS